MITRLIIMGICIVLWIVMHFQIKNVPVADGWGMYGVMAWRLGQAIIIILFLILLIITIYKLVHKS